MTLTASYHDIPASTSLHVSLHLQMPFMWDPLVLSLPMFYHKHAPKQHQNNTKTSPTRHQHVTKTIPPPQSGGPSHSANLHPAAARVCALPKQALDDFKGDQAPGRNHTLPCFCQFFRNAQGTKRLAIPAPQLPQVMSMPYVFTKRMNRACARSVHMAIGRALLLSLTSRWTPTVPGGTASSVRHAGWGSALISSRRARSSLRRC